MGAVLSIVGLVSLVYGIIEAPSHGWTSPQTLGTLTFAAVVLAAFAIWELRSDHPMLDVTFFENRRFTAANISIVLVFFALFGSLFFLTQYLQFVLGYTRARSRGPRRAAGARADGRRRRSPAALTAASATRCWSRRGWRSVASGLWFMGRCR